MSDHFRYANSDDALQEGGHTTEWYLRQAALRNASMLESKPEATYIATSVEKGSTEPIEDTLTRSENYLANQRAREFKTIREHQENSDAR